MIKQVYNIKKILLEEPSFARENIRSKVRKTSVWLWWTQDPWQHDGKTHMFETRTGATIFPLMQVVQLAERSDLQNTKVGQGSEWHAKNSRVENTSSVASVSYMFMHTWELRLGHAVHTSSLNNIIQVQLIIFSKDLQLVAKDHPW